jgi:hypothetical protein
MSLVLGFPQGTTAPDELDHDNTLKAAPRAADTLTRIPPAARPDQWPTPSAMAGRMQ